MGSVRVRLRQRGWSSLASPRAAAFAVATTLATVGFVAVGAPAASADPGDVTIETSPPASQPTDGTTPIGLTWTFDSTGVTQCELDLDGSAVQPAAQCSSPVTFDEAAVGSYELTVTPVGPGAAASSTVTLVPQQVPITSSPSSPGADPTPKWRFSVMSGATATCTVSDSGQNVLQTEQPCTSPFVADSLAGDGFGTYTFSVTQSADNLTSAPATSSYDYEAGPSAPTVTADKSVGSGLHPTFSVTGIQTGATLGCSVDGPSGGPAVTVQVCGATSALDLTGGDDGVYTLSVTQQVAGVTSPAGTASYTLDTSSVSTPTVTADKPYGASASPTFSVGNIDPGATLSCSASGPSAVSVQTCDTTSVLSITGGVNGTYTLTVHEVDGQGEAGADASATYEYEPTAPPAPDISPASSAGKDPTPSFAVTDTEDVTFPTYTCALTDAGGAPMPKADITQCGSTVALDLTGADDGTYTLAVSVTDESGQQSPDGTATYTVDRSTPAPDVALAAGVSSPSSDTTPEFDITDSESLDGPDTFTCKWTGPSGTILPAGTTCTDDEDFPANAGDGKYTLTVTAQDTVGNTATATPVTYELESGAPPAPTVTATPPAGQSTTATFTVTDTDDVDLTYNCSMSGIADSAITCGATTTVDLAGSTDGPYTLVVTVTDALGDTSLPGSATYTLDRSAQPPTVSLAPPDFTPSSNTSPAFVISDNEKYDGPDSFTCEWDGPAGVIIPAGTSCTSGETFPASGGDGRYTLYVAATDQIGNVSDPQAATATYDLDTTAPAPPTVTLVSPPTSPGSSPSPMFSVSNPGDLSPGGLTYTCSVTGPTPVPDSAVSCGSTTTIDLSGPNRDGTYTLSVMATDAAGNVSPGPGTASYTLDTTDPLTPLVTLISPSSSPSSSTSPEFSVSNPNDNSPGGLTYSCSVTGPTPVPDSAVSCGPDTTVDLSGTGRDGTYTLEVTATDAAGNTSTVPGTAVYTLDTTPPGSPHVVLREPASSPGSLTTPQFSVTNPGDTSPGGLTYSCAVTGPTNVPDSAVDCGPTTTIDLSGTGRDGTYTLAVTATDAAGNVSAQPGTATYTLDTTPPEPPLVGLASATRSSNRAPLWTWQFGLSDTSTASDSVACVVTGPNGWTTGTLDCAHHFSTVLGGGDGIYHLTVTLTDAAGNASTGRSPAYRLDSRAPAGPTVYLADPGSGAGRSLHPRWVVVGPPGSTLMCTLLAGGHSGKPIVHAACPQPATFNLAGHRDGLFTLKVIAIDSAGNHSFPAWSSYVLSPTAPQVRAPADQNPQAKWTVRGNPHDGLLCTLYRGRVVVSPQAPCSDHPVYDMTRRPAGEYTLSVVQVGAWNAHSAPGIARWHWNGERGGGFPPPTTPPPGSTPKHQGTPAAHHPGSSGGVLPRIPGVVRHQLQKLSHIVTGSGPVVFPHVHPNRAADDVVSAVQGVVHAVGSAGGGTGFPLLLIGLVLAFLLAQNRIDRRDPKLALASIAADDWVEFQPPPPRTDRR